MKCRNWIFLYMCLSLSFSLMAESYSALDAHGVAFDKKITELLDYQNGVFIEVGAFDGLRQSNTALLEKRYGWTGVLIEPSPCLFQRLCKNRPHSVCFQCALGSFPEDETFVFGDFTGRLMNSIGGNRMGDGATVLVKIRSLQSILDEVGISHVNFFSLDTEGYEFHVLQGIDFERVTFDYVLVEIYTTDFETICSFLDEKGYELVENFSQYDHTLPKWDGSHNDYLFKRKDL